MGTGFFTLMHSRLSSVFRRYFNVNEVLDMLEDSGDFSRADIYIEPPAVDELTDEDSGDEDCGGTIQNLNGRQLAARASATVIYADGREQVGEDDVSNN